jgi:alcohol dehydrogenase
VTQRLVIEGGASSSLADEVSQRGWDRLLVVAGGASFALSGANATVIRALAGHDVRWVDDVKANPGLDALEAHTEQLHGFRPDAVIAVGGGSVLDMAKLLALTTAVDVPPRVVVDDPGAAHDLPAIVAIPTTSGSGSESTPFAVLYVDGVKRSIEHPGMLPEVALVDSDLSSSMPPYLTAVSGLDCLAHAVESMWSLRSTTESRGLATEALGLVWSTLVAATHEPTPESRYAMARAANLAGRAIAISRTTLCHALAYRMTSAHGVPHGLAVGLTLGEVLVFNARVTLEDVVDPRGHAHVTGIIGEICALLDSPSAEGAQFALSNFMGELGVPTRLSALGIDAAGRSAVVDSVDPVRLSNNPRAVDRDGLTGIIEAVA